MAGAVFCSGVATPQGQSHKRGMALYAHVPFCARRCPYCDFAIQIGAKAEFITDYMAMLQRELQGTLSAHAASFPEEELTSIYFGGGTPTLVDAPVLADTLRLIGDNARVAPDAEVTIEANPDGLTEEKLAALREVGWNRLSFGAQSFDETALRTLGRTHSARQIEDVFAAARRAGFANISLDLIFAVPDQDRAAWRATLQRAAALEPEHVSCYALTIEEGTPFARRVARGQMLPMQDDDQAALMEETARVLGAAALERYEVSNYARRGFESRHNGNYWRGGNYLACGCGAHGHRDGHRWWNERSAAKYVSMMRAQKTARAGEEFLTAQQRLSEIVMLGLRLRDGFNLDEASRQAGLDARRELNGKLQDLTARGILRENGETIRLAPDAIPLADAVAARLLS